MGCGSSARSALAARACAPFALRVNSAPAHGRYSSALFVACAVASADWPRSRRQRRIYHRGWWTLVVSMGKIQALPHDHWWANFVRAARLRTEQLRAQLGPDAQITWLVYKQGYLDRAQQEHQDLIGFSNSVGD